MNCRTARWRAGGGELPVGPESDDLASQEQLAYHAFIDSCDLRHHHHHHYGRHHLDNHQQQQLGGTYKWHGEGEGKGKGKERGKGKRGGKREGRGVSPSKIFKPRTIPGSHSAFKRTKTSMFA